MKKLTILIAGLFIAGTIFTSCEKEEEKSSGSSIGKATIKGIVEMNSDVAEFKLDKDGNLIETEKIWEFPAGVQLTATIDANELVQDPDYIANGGANYGKKTYYTTIAADGTYSFSIDAGARSVSVDITGVDLRKDLITYVQYDSVGGFQDSIMADGTPVYRMEKDDRKIWSMALQNVNVTEKHIEILDFKYN